MLRKHLARLDVVLKEESVPGRKLDARWTLVLPVLALAAVVLVFLSRNDAAQPHRARAAAIPTATQPVDLHDFRAPVAAPTATLLESLQAAEILVKAGKLAPPASTGDTWRAVDALIKAGVLPTPPWAVNAEPTPTLQQTLEAANILVKAGKIPAPPWPHAQSAPPQAPADAPVATATAQPPTAAPPTSTPPPPTSTPVPASHASAASTTGDWSDDAFNAAVFAGVNQRRTSAGLAPLAVEPRLANSASSYAGLMIEQNWFAHVGPDGSTLVTRDEAAGFPFTTQVGEVLAWGSNGWTAAEIVQAWMDSPAHHEQIMSAVYTRAGAGCYFSKSGGSVTVKCAMELAGT